MDDYYTMDISECILVILILSLWIASIYFAIKRYNNIIIQVALQKPYSEKVDVYSFGVLLWQMITLQKPYSYNNTNVIFGRVVLNGERPVISSNFPKYINELLTQCWDRDSNNRPDFNSIVHTLEEVLYLLKHE